jgi:Protein of unknown function (DUF732)
MTNTKKHISGIAAALVLTAGLVGCGTRNETSATSIGNAKIQGTTSTTYSQSDKVDALVKVLQARLGAGSRDKIIDIAKQACVVIDEAGSVIAAIRGIASDPEIDYETASDMAYIIGVSVPVYCPEYLDQVQRYLND